MEHIIKQLPKSEDIHKTIEGWEERVTRLTNEELRQAIETTERDKTNIGKWWKIKPVRQTETDNERKQESRKVRTNMGWIPKQAITEIHKKLGINEKKATEIFKRLNTIAILMTHKRYITRCKESIRAKAKKGIYTKKWRMRYFDRGIT